MMSERAGGTRPSLCILTAGHSPLDDRVFYKEARSLARTGYRVSLVAYGDGPDEVRDGVLILRIARSPLAGSRALGRPVWIARFVLRSWRVRAEIYHAQEFTTILWAWAFKVLRGSRLVYDVHEWYPDVMFLTPRGGASRLLVRALRRLELRACRDADLILAVSDALREQYRRLPRHGRVEALPNYPPLDLFEGRGAQPRKSEVEADRRPAEAGTQQRPAGMGTQRIIYAGLLSLDRGIGVAMEAIQQVARDHPGVCLELLGPFRDGGEEIAIRHLAASLGAEKFCHLRGVVPHPEVAGHLRRAAIGLALLQPIPYYARQPMVKIYEYLACGLPVVIACQCLEAAWVVESGCGIAVDPSDPADVARALRGLLDDPQRAREMGARGAEAVRARYHWGVCEERLLALYGQLLTPGGSSAR